MTSFLAFSWRRERSNKASDEQPNEPSSPLPPAVSASRSGDTCFDGEDSNVIKVTRRHDPRTPEGLRPRRATSFLRWDLGLPQEWEQQEYPRSHLAVLPPPPTESWSTQEIMSSPPVSTSSFYARGDSCTNDVAESPHLLPGQARTAVGAVVALQHRQRSVPVSRTFLRSTAQPVHDLGPLPARRDWHFESPQLRGRHHASEEDDSGDENEEPNYYRLDDPLQNSQAPFHLENNEGGLADSPISASSSLIGSPSSRAGIYYRRDKDNVLRKDNNTSFSSQAALIGLANVTATGYDFEPLVIPDDNCVSGAEIMLATPNNPVNVSAMSHPALDNDFKSARIIAEDGKHHSLKFHIPEEDKYSSIEEYPHLDGALLKSKTENQRHAKEELILSAAYRLQDNLQLVAEVEAVGCEAVGMGNWFIKTPLDKEGLLTGFPEEKRSRIIRLLTILLDEMNKAVPEEFFMSPSMIPHYSESHNDLRQALVFCRTLIKFAVPTSEKIDSGKWRFLTELRSSLGILPPESPVVVRGGDTSLFSLPSGCEDTPMTSNVSLSTTITSALTTPIKGRGRQIKPPTNGLIVRRTIQIFTTLVQRLSLVCLELARGSGDKWHLSAQDSIRLTETIKRVYLQLLDIEPGHLHAVVDSFRYELKPLGVTRETKEDMDGVQLPRNFVLPPAPPMRSFLPNQGRDIASQPIQATAHIGENGELPGGSSGQSGNEVSSEAGLFSPSTEDMRTHHPGDNDHDPERYEMEYDDLRRQVGSSDYDDVFEERDEPP